MVIAPFYFACIFILVAFSGHVSLAGSGSTSTSCDGEDKDGSCVNRPAIFDAFAKWIEDTSSEGQKILDQILGSSAGRGGGGAKSQTSFFDEIKDTLAGNKQAKEDDDEDNILGSLWRGIIAVKDAVDETNAQFSKESSGTEPDNAERSSKAGFDLFAFFEKVFSASNTRGDSEESRKLAAEFIQKASELTHYMQSGRATRGFLELHDIMMKSLGEVTESIWRNFGHIDWSRIYPINIAYFVEHMESLLTPSWKRRAHAFSPNISEKEVKELHKALYLANLAYLNTVDEIRQGLENESGEWELIYAQLKTAPGEPAHYIALRKGQQSSSGVDLEVLLVVRGTKDFADVLSDGLLDAVEFRGGLGHAGLVQSGKFLVDHHINLFRSLLELSEKEKIKLTLFGHSLGAGAAAIAALIFNEDHDLVDANVVAFGSPALLSKELSDSLSSYVTTIISDSDMIPRLSGPTLNNAILDIMSYDWVDKGLADLKTAIDFIRRKLPFDIPREHAEGVYSFAEEFLNNYVKVEIEEMANAPREDVILIPPGNCVHFYRDGISVTGQKISCDFFTSLEISRTMVDDHMIGIGYNRMLLDYMRYSRGDYQFTFERKIV